MMNNRLLSSAKKDYDSNINVLQKIIIKSSNLSRSGTTRSQIF